MPGFRFKKEFHRVMKGAKREIQNHLELVEKHAEKRPLLIPEFETDIVDKVAQLREYFADTRERFENRLQRTNNTKSLAFIRVTLDLTNLNLADAYFGDTLFPCFVEYWGDIPGYIAKTQSVAQGMLDILQFAIEDIEHPPWHYNGVSTKAKLKRKEMEKKTCTESEHSQECR